MGEIETRTYFNNIADLLNEKTVTKVFRRQIACNCDELVIVFEDGTEIQIPVDDGEGTWTKIKN
jgi:hypothetical protein